VGGLKEKALAALRAGLKTVLVPAKNQKELSEIPAKVRRKLLIKTVDHMDEILDLALTAKPKKLTAKKLTRKGRGRKAAPANPKTRKKAGRQD
jgi:ATP-dependent Lon protease